MTIFDRVTVHHGRLFANAAIAFFATVLILIAPFGWITAVNGFLVGWALGQIGILIVLKRERETLKLTTDMSHDLRQMGDAICRLQIENHAMLMTLAENDIDFSIKFDDTTRVVTATARPKSERIVN